jgi:hypothetical protein
LLFVREVGLTQTKFLHVLQDVKLHSCHYSQNTYMFPENRPSEINFFWLLHQTHCDERFMHSILWRDEACYLLHCVFNIHNTFTWERISSAIVRYLQTSASHLGLFRRDNLVGPVSYQILCLRLDFMGLFYCSCLKKRL